MRKIRLVKNWKKVLRHSSTIWIIAVAVVLSGVEAFVPYLPALVSIDPFWMALLTPVTLMAALVARLVAQKSLSGEDDADR